MSTSSELCACLLDVLDINDHRAGPAAGGLLNTCFTTVGISLMSVTKNCVSPPVGHHRNQSLKSAPPIIALQDLSGDGHQRDGVHIRVGDAGDEFVAPGPLVAGNAGLAGGSGVAFSRKDAALFVPGGMVQSARNGSAPGEIPWRHPGGQSLSTPSRSSARTRISQPSRLGPSSPWFRLRVRFCFSCSLIFCAVGCKPRPGGRGLGNSVLFIWPRRSGSTTTSSASCCYDVLP